MKNVLVYVQHLLGIGHLHRTALLTRAIANRDIKVTVVSGGIPEAMVDFGDVDLVQLTPIQSDSGFSELYDQNLEPITQAIRQSRKEMLLEVFETVSPDLVLIETYPFGRRQMRFELLPLLKAIKQKPTPPIAACSIRDIIQPKSQAKRIQEVLDIIEQYFDIVFVHGDKGFIEFDLSFPKSRMLREKLIYTGYVSKYAPITNLSSRDEDSILVSAGGGAVGKRLYEMAIQAAETLQGKRYKWRLLVGNNISEPQYADLCSLSADNVIVERVRADFLELLKRCSASVSQGGYNTMMDILVTETAAVIVPFEGVSEREQLIRAQAFERYELVTVLREKELSAAALISAIQHCQRQVRVIDAQILMDGANKTANIIEQKILGKT